MNYLKQHAQYFQWECQLETIDSLAFFSPLAVGVHCPRAYSMLEEGKEMFKLVFKRNCNALLRWCKSTNPELRVYGFVGLKLVESDGFRLSSEMVQAINRASQLNTKIIYCYGCGFIHDSPDLLTFWKRYKNTYLDIYAYQKRLRN